MQCWPPVAVYLMLPWCQRTWGVPQLQITWLWLGCGGFKLSSLQCPPVQGDHAAWTNRSCLVDAWVCPPQFRLWSFPSSCVYPPDTLPRPYQQFIGQENLPLRSPHGTGALLRSALSIYWSSHVRSCCFEWWEDPGEYGLKKKWERWVWTETQ